MKITCTTTFLDGGDRFEVGDVRTVDDTRGAYFVKQAWAHASGDEAAVPHAGDVTLTVQNATIGQEVSNG